MLYGLVMATHVIVSLALIAVILLQAGRGGGLSESFGGSSTQTILGTKTNVFLTRATAAAAVIYIITCLTLAVMTSSKGRSLVAREGGMVHSQAGGQQGAPTPLPNEPVEY